MTPTVVVVAVLSSAQAVTAVETIICICLFALHMFVRVTEYSTMLCFSFGKPPGWCTPQRKMAMIYSIAGPAARRYKNAPNVQQMHHSNAPSHASAPSETRHTPLASAADLAYAPLKVTVTVMVVPAVA